MSTILSLFFVFLLNSAGFCAKSPRLHHSSFDKRRLVFIVGTKKNEEEIVSFISNSLSRGSTLLDSHGGYTKDERATIMCLLTPRQTMELKRYLAQNHTRAFMVITEASEVLGNGFKHWKNI